MVTIIGRCYLDRPFSSGMFITLNAKIPLASTYVINDVILVSVRHCGRSVTLGGRLLWLTWLADCGNADKELFPLTTIPIHRNWGTRRKELQQTIGDLVQKLKDRCSAAAAASPRHTEVLSMRRESSRWSCSIAVDYFSFISSLHTRKRQQ